MLMFHKTHILRKCFKKNEGPVKEIVCKHEVTAGEPVKDAKFSPKTPEAVHKCFHAFPLSGPKFFLFYSQTSLSGSPPISFYIQHASLTEQSNLTSCVCLIVLFSDIHGQCDQFVYTQVSHLFCFMRSTDIFKITVFSQFLFLASKVQPPRKTRPTQSVPNSGF